MIESDWINYEKLNRNREMEEIAASVEIKDKYLLTIQEAALFFNVGEKTLRSIVASHPKGDFYLTIGKKVMIKKVKFESFIDNQIRL